MFSALILVIKRLCNKNEMCKNRIALFFLATYLMVPYASIASAACSQPIAKIASAQGKVDVLGFGALGWKSTHANDMLCPGDTLRTAKWSRATLGLTSGAVLTVDQNTTMTFSAPQEKAASWFVNLLKGAAFFRSRQPQNLDVNTPFINAVHEGTEFLVVVSSKSTEISVFDGKVSAENAAGKITINKGYKGIAEAKSRPQVQAIKITPEDAVQWSLYYPPIIDDTKGGMGADSQLNPALSAYHQGDSQLALARLDEIPTARQNANYLTLKAALLLTVGRVDEAQPLIQQAQSLEPNNSDAFALQAVIAVAKNKQQVAIDNANKAIAVNPQSPVAFIAQSYAYQSLFNIDEALKSTQTAIRLAPENALAWARLSELQLSQGDHDAALESAQKAQALNPKIARTQTILGFANLAQTEIEKAKHVFEQALALDSSDPLGRLGLGLAKIRQGDVEAGKNELETAVSLDPNNAVIRSYLGKAYYELRNKDYAGKEYEIAKEVDPKDPTPHFYDAILKQTTNRPVEALRDMQKAIELNDNRGVYRSKLLLDSDSAARSASLGRIYNDLGFQQRGLLEGWVSINQDPSNYSAHRLLADNYAALPRHETSRLSELLKAQLLQPINITPVQPQTAESNILILDGLGSSITSFNEYNPLFTRNRFALQASGFYGSRDTISDEVVHSGVWDKFSYSMGQFHYQTEGFRANNDQKKDAYNFFVQGQVTNTTNLQFEYRRSEHEYGDISQGFFKDKFSLLSNGNSEDDIFRGGLHQSLSNNSDLLMSLIHREDKSSDFLETQGEKADLSHKINGTQYELQYMYRHNYFDTAIGMNYLINQSGESKIFFADKSNVNTDDDTDHKAFYIYSNIKLIPSLLVTVGLSQDFYKLSRTGNVSAIKLNREPINPKFGLTWMLSDKTTLRVAAFRSLQRGIIQKQTLEPTLIAGFNQFYDDIEGSIARRIGFGVDHKFNSQFLVGAEISGRYIDVPFRTVNADDSQFFDKTNWNEKNARAYFNWIPNPNLSLGLDYNYERLNRNDKFFDTANNNSNFFTQLETHRTQLFGNYFHPSGFISKLNLAYLNQTGYFLDPDNGIIAPNSSNFWLLDAEVAYRLPKRHGLVALGVKNLSDEKFNFQGTDVNYPQLPQGRFFFSRLTLSF